MVEVGEGGWEEMRGWVDDVGGERVEGEEISHYRCADTRQGKSHTNTPHPTTATHLFLQRHL